MKDYLIIIEKAPRNYSAYCPDLPGCITTARTIKQTELMMREAISLHIGFMREQGEVVPLPTAVGAVVRVNA